MCGIAGLIDLKSAPGRSIEPGILKRMTDSIAHRGPDAESFHFEPGIGLGHRRLSIIDVATGQQPMSNEDDTVWVVFNGEIYNFAEVRKELEGLGHRFKTAGSDTEIILHGWEQWGAACLEKFRGMFAFLLWDRNKRQIFMARDRMGVKPLYYAILPSGLLAFGSELKTIMTLPEFRRVIRDDAVEDFLALGYVPDPKTIFTDAHKLAPAHYVLFQIGADLSHFQPKRYWSAPFGEERQISFEQAQEELDHLLAESVKLRMISEVPLGAFLSGGVDSSIVVAEMAKASSQPVLTCSIGFESKAFDESQYAKIVAEQYKTNHSEFTVDGQDSHLFDKLPSLFDEPFADASALPTYRVSELARQRVTVALSGDGGDETFAGYRRYRLHMAEESIRNRIPAAIRSCVFSNLGRIYPKLDWAPQWMRAKTTFQGIGSSASRAYFDSVSAIRSEVCDQLRAPAFQKRLAGYSTYSIFKSIESETKLSGLSLIQAIDYQTYLPGDINVKVDRTSMVHSLETREPLMDHKIIEWAARLDRGLHLEINDGKRLLKALARKRVSPAVIDRPKRGFVVPIAEWLKGSVGQAISRELLSKNSQGALFGYVRHDAIEKLLTEHQQGRRDNSRALWSVANLAACLKTYA